MTIEPEVIEFHLADDIFIMSGSFKEVGTRIPQHSHEYDHTSFIATGAVEVWCDSQYLGEYKSPTGLLIKKNTKHTFMTTEENTTILCIHNISRNGMIEIHDLHELTD
jgi:quercetin dioxygenase-like cupin family protein